MRFGTAVYLLVLSLMPCQTLAQSAPVSSVITQGRASENVVTQAEDGFGKSIGNDEIGIYSSFDVRGFSPTAAGNVRIDGLYFDQVWRLPARIRQSTTIRVGISAQGFPFPAPTGVVDYAFRKAGNDPALSVSSEINTYGAGTLELDATLPLIDDKLSLGGGVGLYHNEFPNGTNSNQHVEGVSLRWTPTPAIEIIPYWARSDIYDDRVGPLYIPAGDYLPPPVPRRRFNGPDWAVYEGTAVNYGAFGSVTLSPSWQLRGGAFRSFFDNHPDSFTFLNDLTPEGRGNFNVLTDPPSKLASTSGELRLTHRFAEGARFHTIHLNVRARDRTNRYDGTEFFDLGPSRIGAIISAPQPIYNFGPQTRDRVNQVTFGVAYEGRWKDVGEISFGIQKTRYRKTTEQPGLPTATSRADPWLFNFTAAAQISDVLALYGGYTRGLEESGVAPANAINRNEALPAIITTQSDVGLRWTITPKLKLIAGLFDVRKPYFNLDGANRFALLGDTKNQGIELSLSGSLTPKLDVVVGAVLSRPRVTGEGVTLGRLGPKPVGQSSRRADLNIDWRPPLLDGLSFNGTVSYQGDITATRNNLVSIPARTLIDLGARYQFKLSGRSASLRLSASNITDKSGFDLRGAGAYDLIDGRIFTTALAIDL